jgi:hypothetical protein
MSYARTIPISLGASKAGLALQAQLTTTAGVNVGSPITTGFAEQGGGTYLWTYGAFADATTYGVKFADQSVPGTVLATTVIEPDLALLQSIGGGAGATLRTFTITHAITGSPLDGVEAWVTTSNDPNGNLVASDTSDSDGIVEFMLDNGTYWLWQQLAGFNTPAGTEFTVP